MVMVYEFNIGDRVRTDTYYPNPIGDHIGTITKFKMIGNRTYVSVILDEIQNEFSIDGEFLIPPEHLISMTGSILNKFSSMNIYYAHHQWKYGTKIEEYELSVIRRYFPHARIINPATDISVDGMDESDIMKVCLKEVDKADIVVFSALDGCVGSGVYQEVTRAKSIGKVLYFLTQDKLFPGSLYHLEPVMSASKDRIFALVQKIDE